MWSGVCERSSTGKFVPGFENEFASKKLDYHDVQISDIQYLKKVFKNFRQKLKRSENEQVLDEKTIVLIWGLFMSMGNITMKIWLSTRTQISKSSRRCSTSLRG